MNRVAAIIVLVALAVVALGAYQLLIAPAYAASCPSGGGCGCGTGYAPVVCKGHCRYTNMCHATCAGFDSNQCKSISN